MRNFPSKVCKHCGQEYTPTGSSSKYCSKKCQKEVYKSKHREYTTSYRIRHNIGNVGVGKGGSTGFGKDNPYYKTGLGIFAKERHKIKKDIRYCQLCGKDLIDTTQYQWCVHHIDHNRDNNDPSNWMLVCKQCHQIEHKCWLALQGATTSLVRLPNGRYSNPNKRKPQESAEVPDTLSSNAEGSDIV